MELLGGTNYNNVIIDNNVGISSLILPGVDNSPYKDTTSFDEGDQFIGGGSQSALEQFKNQLEIYQNSMNTDDPKQMLRLEKSKALLSQMQQNIEKGTASEEEINQYIRDCKLIEEFSQDNKRLLDKQAIWLSLTGAKKSNLETDLKTIDQNIEATQNNLKEFLKKASPEKIAKVQSDREAAKQRAQKVGMRQDLPEVQDTDQAFNEANKTAQDKLRDEISDLEKKLKNPNLPNDERQSYEQRIEKIKKAIEFFDKIKDDPDFRDKILSKLSPEEQKRFFEDIKNKKLTEESLQAINRATAAADETGTINEGFFALSKQSKRQVTGMTHEEYHAKYKDQMNLDKSEFIKTNIELKVYSRDSAYDSSSYSSNSKNDSKDSNLSLEQKVEDMISELQSRGELSSAEQSLNNKDIAQKLGLKPDHPIVLAIAAGDYDLAQRLSAGLNVETSVNAIATENNATVTDGLEEWLSSVKPIDENNPGNKFFGLSFA